MRPDTWTPEQDARIHALRAENKSYRQIGEIMGKSEKAITSRFHRLKHRANGTSAHQARSPLKIDGKYEQRMAIWRRQRKGARLALAQMGAT